MSRAGQRKSRPVFTTPTGQTGKDAYVYEASAIWNAQRALDERFHKLKWAVRDENPDLMKHPTDFITAGAEAAEHFMYYLQGREKEYLGG